MSVASRSYTYASRPSSHEATACAILRCPKPMRSVRMRTAFGDGLKGSPSVAERKLAPVTWSLLTNSWRFGLRAEQQIIASARFCCERTKAESWPHKQTVSSSAESPYGR